MKRTLNYFNTLLIITVFASTSATAMSSSRRIGSEFYSMGGDPYAYKLLEARTSRSEVLERVNKLKAVLALANNQEGFNQGLQEVKCSSLEDLQSAIQDAEKELKIFSTKYSNLLNGNALTPERALFQGLAGDGNYDYSDITTFSEALRQGMILVLSKEVSDFLRGKIRGVLQDKLGFVFDGTINAVSEGCNRLYQVLFHGGKKPFEEGKLLAWKNFVSITINDIEKAIKAFQKSANSAQDMTMRNANALGDVVGDGTEENQPGVNIAEKLKIQAFEQVWPNLFAGAVIRLDFFSSIIENNKAYYSDNEIVMMLASQIQLCIKQFNNLMMCVTSAADVDQYLGPNAPALPTMRANIESLFNMLILYIKQQPITSTTMSSSSAYDRSKQYGSYSGRNKNNDDDYMMSAHAN